MIKQQRNNFELKLFQFLLIGFFSFTVVIALLNAFSVEVNLYDVQFYLMLLFTLTILYKPFRIVFFRCIFYLLKRTIVTIKSIVCRKDTMLEAGNIDEMTSLEFKHFLKSFFEKKGFVAMVIHHSEYQIADLILWKGTKKYVVKAAYSSSRQSIRPIQEAMSAMNHHRANDSIVVSNQFFTNSAKILAEIANVKLIDREELIDTLNAYSNKKYIFQSALSFILHK